MSQLFISGGENNGASASTPVLPINIQGWFPLGWTGLISLLSKGFSRVFNTHHTSKASWGQSLTCQLLAPFFSHMGYLFKMDIVLIFTELIEHFIQLTTHSGS